MDCDTVDFACIGESTDDGFDFAEKNGVAPEHKEEA